MQDREYLEVLLTDVLNDRQITGFIQIDKPSNLTFGDYTSNVAMLAYKQLAEQFANPRLLAQDLAEQVKQLDQQREQRLAAVEVAGTGFINFKLHNANLWQVLSTFLKSDGAKLQDLGQGRSAIVEYSSPNIAKPFTIGHLRSTIIGDAVANLLEASGYRVFRDNHLGDWGTQFGKQIVAIKKWGNEAALEQASEPVKALVDLYVKFHQEAENNPSLEDEARAWFLKLEQGDSEARRLWQKCIDWSFREFALIYERLGVKFTENEGRGYGESYFEDKMSGVIDELKAKGLVKEGEEGALLIFYPKNLSEKSHTAARQKTSVKNSVFSSQVGSATVVGKSRLFDSKFQSFATKGTSRTGSDDEFSPLMILKKDGSTLYATRDLATDKWRLTQERYQNRDGRAPLVINEVGAEQAYYFQQLYRAEELLGWYQPNERVHVKHGLYRFKEGKMSTRKGNVIWLQEVLDKALEKATAINANPKIAQAVSIAALKWNDLKRKSEININFDWDEILQLQGNSGPYLLYSYVRAQSVLAKQTANISTLANNIDVEAPLSEEEKAILSQLTEFSNTVAKAASSYAPNILCNYLYELAQSFNSFYNKHQILTAANNLRNNRLAITAAVSSTLARGLSLLGISTVEEM